VEFYVEINHKIPESSVRNVAYKLTFTNTTTVRNFEVMYEKVT